MFLLRFLLSRRQQELSAIWSMGFDADVVQRALVQTDGNEERAVNLIITDRCVRVHSRGSRLIHVF